MFSLDLEFVFSNRNFYQDLVMDYHQIPNNGIRVLDLLTIKFPIPIIFKSMLLVTSSWKALIVVEFYMPSLIMPTMDLLNFCGET